MPTQIRTDAAAIAALCRRHGIRRLSLFGSVLRSDFGPDSDVDVLVEFEPGIRVGLLRLAGISHDLEQVLGRRVDLVPEAGLKPDVRADILPTAEVVYAAG